MGGFEPKPGARTLVQSTFNPPSDALRLSPGKRTLVDQCVMAPELERPQPGINKTGFIDNSAGSNIRTAPAELGGEPLTPVPLPPAMRVFVTGTHPRAPQWWYVTTYVDDMMVRGYVQGHRIVTELPEPLAELCHLYGGETVEGMAKSVFGHDVRDGHDLRYYENVLLHVNQGRAGIRGSYQDPGVLGGGVNNIELVAGHRIWLVSPEYAKAVESVVPSGSLTGGGVAKVKRFAGHLMDILESVVESRNHVDSVAGEFAQDIRDNLPAIIGITSGFLMAEAGSMFLAASPTGASQAIAAIIQLALSAFGAEGMIEASWQAAKHGNLWLTTAWVAHGKPAMIVQASCEFLRMLVVIAIAALNYSGARGNYRNALKIGNKIPTGGLPALATGGAGEGVGVGAGVEIGPGMGAIGTALRSADKKVDAAGDKSPDPVGSKTQPAGEKPPGRVEDPVDGLYDSVDPTDDPPGWTMKDALGPRKDGSEIAVTHVEAPDGTTGYIERAYNPFTNELEMVNVFIHNLPRWIDNGGPALRSGKGMPTVAYLTFRQMKLLGIDYGKLSKVRMAKIQNIESVIQLNVMMQQGIDVHLAVMKTKSVSYAETSLIQSGHRITAAKVTRGFTQKLDYLLRHYETHARTGGPRDPAVIAKHDKLLAEHGQGVVTRDTNVFYNYDIELTVAPNGNATKGTPP